jgi:lipopolysaccharide export system protein LptA
MILRCAAVCLLALPFMPRARSAEQATTAAPPPAQPAPAAPSTPAQAPAVPLIPTVIESGSAEMVSSDTETTFTFRQDVTVTATNMKLTCDELVVIAKRSGDPAATIGKQEQFKSLIATGNVRLIQGDREATCGRAAVYPGEDKVELTENPVVRSLKEGWEQTGPRMVLYRGERRAVVERSETERPKLVLPPLKDLGDLGQDREKEKQKQKQPRKDGQKETPPPTPPEPAITVPSLTPPR